MSNYWNRWEQLRPPTQENMILLESWVEHDALPWLWDELTGAVLEPKRLHPTAAAARTCSALKPMKDAEAVRHGLFTSNADHARKATEKKYYHAQLTMLDAEAKRYCESIRKFSTTPVVFAREAVVITLHGALHDMMGQAIALMESAAREVTDLPMYYAAWRRQRETPFEVFKGTEQSIYGTFSGMTHADRAPYTPVAVLRTAIELRLRQAFGVSGLLDPDKPDDFLPIDLSKLFEAVQAHQSEIEFAVNLHDVWKIYRWSNFYLHGGFRDYPWVPGFLLQYLRPLFVGHSNPNGGWDIKNGIQMKRATWHAVRSLLEPGNVRRSLSVRLTDAWRALISNKRRRLQLIHVNEARAECVFYD